MWTYKDELFTSEMIGDNVGFVYLLHNIATNKYYVGKKLFTSSKTFQKNNKKKRKRVESDWETYHGSNDLLKEDVKSGNVLVKTILHLCPSRGWLTYMETKEIIEREALMSEDYYNQFLGCKIHAKHLKGKQYVR
tara:strand:+ start:1553 stop:1957 length:405 start_codon:yes stop_codon:yes gene_type:complete